MDNQPPTPTTPKNSNTPPSTPPNDEQAQSSSFQPTVKVEATPTSPISDVVGVTPTQTTQSSTVTQPKLSEDKGKNAGKPDSNSSKISKIKLLLILFIVAIVAGAALFGGYSVAKSSGDSEIEKLNSKIAKISAVTHELPSDAVELSKCIPNMGFHYQPKGADPEYGPFLLVNAKKEVIGVEYMHSPDMYTAVPNTTTAVSVVLKETPMYNWTYDHADMSYWPDGHHGLLEAHNDTHMYTVTRDDQKQACIE